MCIYLFIRTSGPNKDFILYRCSNFTWKRHILTDRTWSRLLKFKKLDLFDETNFLMWDIQCIFWFKRDGVVCSENLTWTIFEFKKFKEVFTCLFYFSLWHFETRLHSVVQDVLKFAVITYLGFWRAEARCFCYCWSMADLFVNNTFYKNYYLIFTSN